MCGDSVTNFTWQPELVAWLAVHGGRLYSQAGISSSPDTLVTLTSKQSSNHAQPEVSFED
jgi:hypothetical protein